MVPSSGIAPRDARGETVFRRPAGATTTNDGSSDAAAAASREDAPQVGPKKLKPADEKLVNQLAQIDRKVRAHEAAHQAAAGSLGGAVSFTYETGPDGKSYAIGGEVPILISPGRTPDETIARAEQVRAAALAPADPSPQDLAVAAVASQMEAQARQQMAELQAAEPQPQARPQAGAAPRARPGKGLASGRRIGTASRRRGDGLAVRYLGRRRAGRLHHRRTGVRARVQHHLDGALAAACSAGRHRLSHVIVHPSRGAVFSGQYLHIEESPVQPLQA